MELNDILFSVNAYDHEGDVTDYGIYLHFGDTRVKVAENLDGFRAVLKRLDSMEDEIVENYQGFGVF